MAGVKGRSGGARPNSGPKPRHLKANSDDPMEFLRQVMQETTADAGIRVRAAVELARLEKVVIPGAMGKKGAKTRAAQEAASGDDGKFAPAAPPRMVVNNDRG